MNVNLSPAVYDLAQGDTPLLISIPHGGSHLPTSYARYMTPVATVVADTDWHLERLYAFARDMGASVLKANYSRYVIDLNRPPDGASLYPDQTTTGLCPEESFRGEALYLPGHEPDEADRADRVARYWQPYHQALYVELARLRARYGRVLLWEAHSIASMLPRLFDGRLSDLNIGTHCGAACDPAMRDAAITAARAGPFTWVTDGRFKGGYITRHYGQPSQGVHAVQLEMAQRLYMNEEAPFDYREDLADRLLPTLRSMVSATLAELPA